MIETTETPAKTEEAKPGNVTVIGLITPAFPQSPAQNY
jgi:hypothetical protein